MTKPESLQVTKHLDFMWMISFNLLENTPMWTGWNTERLIEKSSRQRVKYMQHPFSSYKNRYSKGNNCTIKKGF